MKRIFLCVICAIATLSIYSQSWPKQLPEARPGTRWWWFGSAVDSTNLKWNLLQYASHGIGAVEITPIYGVQGNEKNELRYLSPEWMKAIRYTEYQAKDNNIEVDMATGTGWPFGGPWVPINEAACKAVFVDTLVSLNTKIKEIAFALPSKEKSIATLQKAIEFKSDIKGKKRVIALYISRTRQMVKRAAPGGEGYVIDHFDKNAVMHYLAHIDSTFNATKTPFPHTFFNDSYEVYGADWTPTLLDEFSKLRGYKLETCFDKLLDGDSKTLSDYRETLSDMLLENFTNQWTAWAHSHGAITRNQAHGSPANLIDCYAAVDIPEIEGFGLSDFKIKGLRKDPGMTKTNFSDLSMLKYAPSAAHITGKLFTSSETFTWLTEHFRTSLSQMKPDMDLMFCAGVNHMFFHGTPYSPKDAEWPGWKFYASVDMSPTNSIWRDAPYLMSYITRCQSF
ncbi:MAG: glycosyl hydrolase family 2, partial [Prevotella sp.]|nr:glycosyl hydrolase family 2 [Prevotella sp.]